MALIATLMLLTASLEPAEDVVLAAGQARVDATDLQGAVNTTGLEPLEYLYMTGELKRPKPAAPPSLREYGLSPYLTRVAACESDNFRSDVVYGPTRGGAGEIGLFQLHPAGLLPLFRQRGFSDPWNPQQQAEFATWAFANGLASHWSCR